MENISEIEALEHEEIEEMPSLQVNTESHEISISVKAINKNRKQKNYNKQTLCDICSKQMRNDKVKRHMKTHADIIAMDNEARTAELSKLQQAYEFRELQK